MTLQRLIHRLLSEEATREVHVVDSVPQRPMSPSGLSAKKDSGSKPQRPPAGSDSEPPPAREPEVKTRPLSPDDLYARRERSAMMSEDGSVSHEDADQLAFGGIKAETSNLVREASKDRKNVAN